MLLFDVKLTNAFHKVYFIYCILFLLRQQHLQVKVTYQLNNAFQRHLILIHAFQLH